MKVTVSFYREAKMVDGKLIPIAASKLSSEMRSADGSFVAAPDEARIVRIATDTSIHFDLSGAASTADDLLPGGTFDYLGVDEGAVVSILTA